MASPLAEMRCRACEGEVGVLSGSEIQNYLQQLATSWRLSADGCSISADYSFRNFYQTMAFVNAVAWIAHSENHHPDLRVGFRDCTVSYHTHAVGGLTINDFVCAAKVDALSC